ncbi:unnamed protein product [Closterium sp. Naga37s-1]|nr:unnamed protein product [Closterium sp. Naga37s-1]
MLVVLTGKPATYEDDTNHSRGILKWVCTPFSLHLPPSTFSLAPPSPPLPLLIFPQNNPASFLHPFSAINTLPLPPLTSFHLSPPRSTTHSPPQHPQVQEKLGQGGSIEEIADACMGPVPPDALQRITDLAMRCTATFTADRPSMGRIAQEMDALRGEVGGGEEQQVHKAYEVVDAELRARMQQQQKMSEQSMDSFLDSIHSGKIGSMRDTGGMSTGDASNV